MIAAMTSHMPRNRRTWLKRVGFLGFAFFFIKGLLWIAAGLVFYTLT